MLLFIFLFTIIQFIFAWPEAPNAVCPLPSSQLFPADFPLPHLFFEFQGVRLIADFITTMSFTHGFFLTERPFFQFTRDNLPAKICRDNLLVTHDPRILATSFPVKLEFKNKNKRNNGTITFS